MCESALSGFSTLIRESARFNDLKCYHFTSRNSARGEKKAPAAGPPNYTTNPSKSQ